MTRPPYVLGGAAMLWGYLKSAFARRERYDDLEFRRFLQLYQRDALLKGRARATAELNQRQAAVWQSRRSHGARPRGGNPT
jgi:hypothetical protein